MPSLRRGSPLGDILLLGTCLSLALPIAPASADPAALPDWGVASKKAAPTTSEPAPAPPAPSPPAPAPAAKPAAEPEPDPVLEPDVETPPRRAPRPAKPKAKQPKPKAPAPPLPAPAPSVPIDPRADSHAAWRKINGELVSGALLASGGLASFGVMAGGLYLNRVSTRELERGEGRPEQELAPLHAQQRRAETMISAGAIAGTAGLALGVALLAIGGRDLKAMRSEPLTARVRIAPTIGGLVLAGRF